MGLTFLSREGVAPNVGDFAQHPCIALKRRPNRNIYMIYYRE